MEVVTFELLFKALRNSIGAMGVDDETIRMYTEIILGFFGFGDYVLDNVLSKEERDLFYMLEEMGILKTRTEEITIKRGKLWRTHYWVLNKERIKELAEKRIEEEERIRIYEKIFGEEL